MANSTQAHLPRLGRHDTSHFRCYSPHGHRRLTLEGRAPGALVLRRAPAERAGRRGGLHRAAGARVRPDRVGLGATAILLAGLPPATLVGPLLGAAIDRTSKLGAAIVADVVRALAFGSISIA